ncbi:hypothetical protein VOLCADRAFT_97274 [Volvox carteri f. nagariensis]|uniref:DUF6570 domain-containing protein n=1 Tax=Volvox carteri f. nagariensis TaxID=3068 RepID=D8UCC2_VOLCA|nr:uncharacterized protein VOLCADRAFT_97274 [Volvox carteri f. nagariensis]EFJ42674.1 hypothetical protein VOLCADRAFT_97274 [Volvox carteri f. nagariensis]|eukprot:XP_002956325.1 hypothetical protein VOLCADRAFT_97274 [Volvox carteri f. nagariensis]
MAGRSNDSPQQGGDRSRERLGTLAGGFRFRGAIMSSTRLGADAEQQPCGMSNTTARQHPEITATGQQRDAAARAVGRENPEYRATEQRRNTAARAAARQDPEYRAAEQRRDTAARAAARQDPEYRAVWQRHDAAARAAAREDPEHRAAEQRRNTAAHAQARDQVHAIQLPQASLLERLRDLMRFPCLHEGHRPALPDFLKVIPEGRVQDLPGGQLPVERQVPYETHLQLASSMAAALRRRMPSRVCAVCSEQCSEDQSALHAWVDIPNVDILRADIMSTAAVPRHACTLAWRRMPCTAQGAAPPPPDPVLPARYRVSRSEHGSSAGAGAGAAPAAFVDEDVLAVDSDGAGHGANEPDSPAGTAEDTAPVQVPPELQPYPPRVQPRPCLEDPWSVEVPFCMRLDADLPNRTMFRDDAGPDRFTICTSCEKALTARRVPEAALARIDPGNVPSTNHLGDPLPAPTFVESQLLGRGRLMQQLMIVHLTGRPPEVLPCAVQSHGIAVVNPDPNMLRGQLPARVADLAGAFTVVCVDQVRDRQDLLDRVRRAPGLKVRGNVIVAWVRFLQHNDEDEGAVDEEALQEYERMGCIARVPEALLHSAIGPTDPEVAGVLRSTFLHDRTGAAGVRQLQETLQGNIAGEIIHGGGAYGSPLATDAGATGLAPVAVVVRQPADPGPLRADADLGVPNELEVVLPQPAPVPTDSSDFDNRPNVVHDLLTGRARLAFAAGGRGAQVLDDRHPAILNVCFPVSFPYGLSGQRPPGMSFASYCSHLVRRVPRAQFSSNLMLLARMYDISVRQQSMAQVGVALRMQPRLGGPAARVPRDVVRTMADILALPYRHAQRRQLLLQQSPVVRALLDGARASLLRIDLTDTYYNGAKAMMRAAALTIGWPPLFFNLNPADMHAGCAVVASGQLIEFDDAGRPTQISSMVEKWRRVKEDPHSCAALLIATKEVLVEQLFGFAPGAMRQTDPNCFCGVVFEVVVKVEQSGRLALHLHGVAHLECFALDNLQALFCGPNCRALALAYALCEMWYPSPYYAPTPDSGTQPLVMCMSDAEAQQHGLPVPAVQADCPPAAYNFERLAGCANGGLPPPSRHAACRAHHTAIIRSTLTHSHSSTCKRHGCRGTDDSCGMAFPRLIRTAFQWIGTTGLFLLPRLAPNLVPHMPAIALAFGCNHLMSLACEVDREYTADIAAQLARPPNERGDCSLLQPAIDRARDAAYYSSKYTAKTIERSQAHLTCAAVGRVQDFMMAGHRPSATGDGPSTFSNLCTVVHRMTATITAGMALVAFKLSGHDTFQATYKRNYLPIGAFTALASESAVEPEDAETGVELVEADEHGDYTLTSVVQNYTQRGVELSGLDCSAYSIASNFEVKRITPAQHPHAAILSAQVLPVPGRCKRKAPGAAMTPTTDAPPAPSGTQPTAVMASPVPAGPSAEQLPTSPMSTIPPKNNNTGTRLHELLPIKTRTTGLRSSNRTSLHKLLPVKTRLGGTVFMLQKQQQQDNSPSGQQLTRFTTMFGGIQPTEARVADLVDALNQRVITDLSDLTDLEPRVVLQRNEPRHALNTRLLMLQARRKGARLVSWNADHVPVRQHGATQQQPLSHVEKAVAMRVKDATFDHTTADTWYYEGARYTLLDTTAADTGACHNNEVEACGLLTDSREPPDDGRGPYWRLHYLPAAVLVRPIKGHAPKAILADLADFATKGAAFAIVPRPSPAANITVPAANTGTTTKNVRRVNVPLGDYYAVTDYFVQGRSFKEECWVADLSVPPGGLKRATMYVLLTRYKTLDHIRLLRPLSTTPDERTRVVKQFMAATKLDPDLAAELRLLDRRATETRERYTTEYKHARNLEERWTSTANTT